MTLRTDDLTIPQGTTWEVRWPVQNDDGTPADLDGWLVRAQARTSKTAPVTLHEWSNAAGNASLIDASVSLRVAPEESSAWEWSSAVFDVEIHHTDGRVARITQGRLMVDSEVTRE